jgi:hypothetical protein
MPIRAQLIQDIENVLGPIVQSNLLPSQHGWDLYEGYIWSLVVEAGRRLGANISYEDILGNQTTSLTFRTNPGTIFPQRNTPVPTRYTHAIISFLSKPPLEVHQGIYVTGKSGLVHECDVVVVSRAEAAACRASGSAHPRCAKSLLAVECKYLSSNPGIKLAREFLGLTVDLWNENRFFVCNRSQDETKRFLTHHKRKWSYETLPSNQTVVNELRSLFQRAFREYTASN